MSVSQLKNQMKSSKRLIQNTTISLTQLSFMEPLEHGLKKLTEKLLLIMFIGLNSMLLWMLPKTVMMAPWTKKNSGFSSTNSPSTSNQKVHANIIKMTQINNTKKNTTKLELVSQYKNQMKSSKRLTPTTIIHLIQLNSMVQLNNGLKRPTEKLLLKMFIGLKDTLLMMLPKMAMIKP